MKKGKIILCLAQLAIIVFFIVLAAGSTESEMTSIARSTAEGANCGRRGYVLIGYYDSYSACSRACHNNGYSSSCTAGSGTITCYCK